MQVRHELAVALAYQGRLREAFVEAQRAQATDPKNPNVIALLGQLLSNTGDRSAADALFRQALAINADHVPAIHGLIGLSEDAPDAVKRFQYVAEQMYRQPVNGQGLLAFYQLVRETETAVDLLPILRAAHAARPDLWPTWQTLVYHLHEIGQRDEALALAQEARDRFPLLDGPYIALARLHAAFDDVASEKRVLEDGRAISPYNTSLLTMLADCFVRLDQRDAAKSLLAASIERRPKVPELRYAYAQLLWDEGDREDALKQMISWNQSSRCRISSLAAIVRLGKTER